MRNSKMKGFTLIELIVVIAIIVVIAAILVPSMMGYVGDSKLSTANANAKLVYTNTATYATKCEVAGYPMNAACTIATATSLQEANVTGQVAAPTVQPTGTDLTNALKQLMGSSTTAAGVFKVDVNASGTPTFAAWAKTADDQYVGAYPNATTAKTAGKIAGVTATFTGDATN